MRKLLVATAMLGMVQGAEAADLPDFPALRGGFSEGLSTTRVIWQGYYAGIQAGYGSSDENFTGSTSAMTARMLANTTIENEMGVSQWPLSIGKASQRAPGFGGFVGYNSQWEDVVVGVEANYLHGKFGGSSTGSQTRFTGSALSDTYYHTVTSIATSGISIKDMATFRARAGYAFGSFLPYMFAGAVLANADITRTTSVVDLMSSTLGGATVRSYTPTASDNQLNHLVYGYTAGLGVDVNLIGGLFMRAEWEYVRFTAAVDTQINTVRGGVGYKF
jgi:opacity protein-like surface antigen